MTLTKYLCWNSSFFSFACSYEVRIIILIFQMSKLKLRLNGEPKTIQEGNILDVDFYPELLSLNSHGFFFIHIVFSFILKHWIMRYQGWKNTWDSNSSYVNLCFRKLSPRRIRPLTHSHRVTYYYSTKLWLWLFFYFRNW